MLQALAVKARDPAVPPAAPHETPRRYAGERGLPCEAIDDTARVA